MSTQEEAIEVYHLCQCMGHLHIFLPPKRKGVKGGGVISFPNKSTTFPVTFSLPLSPFLIYVFPAHVFLAVA